MLTTKTSVHCQGRHFQRGQLLPLLAFGIVALLGMASLAVDVGYWRYQQRLEQSAADSAAVAGAIRLYYPTTPANPAPTEVTLAARTAAADNGFVDDGSAGNLQVTVNSPPAVNVPPVAGATPYPANSAVEVIIKKAQPQFLSGIFGNSNPSVGARAVAVMQADVKVCLYQLGLQDTYGGELAITGNKTAKIINCAVATNGNVSVPGFDWTTTGLNWYGASPPSIGSFDPSKVHQLPSPTVDPCFKIAACAYLQKQAIPPSMSAVDVSSMSSYSAPAAPGFAVIKGCCPYGTTLGSGLYYVFGGVSGTVRGDGVTIVNVDGPMTASGLGAGHPYYTAPTSGPTAGIAYYQPPSNTNDVTLNGGGNGASQWAGVFYAPSAHITANGGGVTFAFLVINGILQHGGGSSQGIVVDPTLNNQVPLDRGTFATHVVLSE
ncbi:MAG: pilus assembly protein TadG-related protein [Vulcanimicrobiaceae bacterium]